MASMGNAAAVRPQARPVRVGVLGTINELDPRKAVDYVSGMMLDQVFESPYAAVAGQASAEPRLFEPLRSEDEGKGLQYSAAIRPDIFFSDGTPLTAELAARSLRGTSVLAGKTKIDVRDNRVWFTLSTPNPRFDLALAQSSCAIVLDSAQQLFGTGPYMFDECPNLRLLQRLPRLRLIRNSHHHGMTRSDEIEFCVLQPDNDGTPRALLEALRGGSIDLTTALSASDLVTWNISGVAPFTRPSNSTAFLYMNTVRRPLDAAMVRKAIAATIDLLEIASSSYDRNPAAFVATAALPPSMSRGGGTVRAHSADAARLIQESGLGRRASDARPSLVSAPLSPPANGRCSDHPAAPGRSRRDALAARDQQQRGSISAFSRPAVSTSPSAAGLRTPSIRPDYYDALLSSHATGNSNFANHSRWTDAATEVALEQFRADPSDAHCRAIERIIAEEVPFLPLMYGQSCVVHGRHIRNMTLSPTGFISLATLTVT